MVDVAGLKPRSTRELRPDGKQQLAQKRDHRPLHYHTPTRASSWITFSGGTAIDMFDPDIMIVVWLFRNRYWQFEFTALHRSSISLCTFRKIARNPRVCARSAMNVWTRTSSPAALIGKLTAAFLQKCGVRLHQDAPIRFPKNEPDVKRFIMSVDHRQMFQSGEGEGTDPARIGCAGPIFP